MCECVYFCALLLFLVFFLVCFDLSLLVFFHLPLCFFKRFKESMKLEIWGSGKDLGGDEGEENIFENIMFNKNF